MFVLRFFSSIWCVDEGMVLRVFVCAGVCVYVCMFLCYGMNVCVFCLRDGCIVCAAFPA